MRRPYTYYEYSNERFAQEFQRALSERPPDLVHVDSLDLVRWFKQIPSGPIACTHHNIESELLRVRADVATPSLLRWYIRHQATLIQRVEEEFAAFFDVNIMMSELDAKRLKSLAPGCRTVTAPNGVDVDFFRPAANNRLDDCVVFLGPSYSLPNRDAIDFFLDVVWPRVRRRRSKAVFQIVGNCPGDDRRRFESSEGVRCLGFVEDIRPILSEASCFVVPLRVGGGTRLKILEGWAMGCPTVSTSIGCEGLAVADGDNILVRDDPVEFAEAVIEVLEDKELQRMLGGAGRSTAVEKYSWTSIGEIIRETYDGLIGNLK